MPRNRISDNIEGIVKYLLTKKYSYSVIQEELSEMNLNVSRSTISRIANQVEKQRQAGLLNSQKPKYYRRRHVATPAVVRRITSYINKENPSTISLMAARCHIGVGTTFRIIRDVIHAKCRKKRPVHRLYLAVIEKRRSRAWRMYRRLCYGRYKNYVTTDEAWFYLDSSQGVRDIYYVRSNEIPEEAGVSAHGKTQLHFIEYGSTITSKYYIEHIIEPFIKYDIPRLFPGDARKIMILHQDSAPGHVAKVTLSYMKEHNIQVIAPHEWLPKSPDAAPMDYSIWGIMKERVRKHKVSTLNGLKNAIKQEWENLEQAVIDNVLENWSKCCRLIYYAHGSHIEHLLQ
ncbi:unnamed protein product [Rotaria sordida]|uniref:Transposase n=1 Tax=Rotaria sordida TaxID=392033 RepID=A0A819YZW2_9BILA|nr:unnamed protein product [Rotaria sordida]